MLKKRNAKLSVFDPFVKKQGNAASLEEAVEGADCVVLCTNHEQFAEALSPDFLESKGIKIVIDCRNCLDKKGITAKGILYRGIGS